MRPVRLELEGFTSFRRKVELDFSGLDLFAITGSTGAGKTSLIDSILFALFGRTPRVSRSNADLISQGAAESKVLFEFRAGGQLYRAYRYIKRKGATKQRLDQKTGDDWETLADKSGAMDAKLRELLGLDFDGFTKTVVLPQGEFDRFLRGEASKRREILIELLGLDVYGRMMKSANELASRQSERARLIEEHWKAHLDGLSEESIAALASQRDAVLAELAGLQSELERMDQLLPLQKRLRETRGWLDECSRLESQLAPLAARRTGAEELVRTAGAALEQAEQALEDARASAAGLESTHGSPDLLRSRAGQARKAMDKKAQIEKLRVLLVRLVQEFQELHSQLKTAEEAASESESAYLQAIAANAANQLRAHLHAGEECPVCEQIVLVTPEPIQTSAVDDAKARFDQSRQTLAAMQKKASAAQLNVKQLEVQIKASESQLADTSEQPEILEELAQAVESARTKARQAEARVTTCRKDLDRARSDFQQTDMGLQLLEQKVQSIHAQLQGAGNIEEIGAELGAYAGKDLEAERKLIAGNIHAAQGKVARLEASIESARSKLAQWEEQRVEIRDLNIQAETARKLGLHLREDRFQTFVLSQTLRRLAAEGTRQLRHLSSNRYSFATRDDEFLVIDHWNADERRSVNTLSGGESFLASLSLALALSRSLPDFTVNRDAIRLDSLFLDEGFSTLDAETMQVVLEAIELLQADGRMIGVVSHIPELAERLPARIEVTKSPGGSAITVR